MERAFSGQYDRGMPEAGSSENTLEWHDRGLDTRAGLRRGGHTVLCLLLLVSVGTITAFDDPTGADGIMGTVGSQRAVAPAAIPGIPGKSSPALAPAEAAFLNDARPIDGKRERAPAFRFLGDEVDLSRAIDCLAAAAYYEAGDDPVGQRAVVQVVLNRARHPAYPDTICGVVFEGAERSTGCQFTFTCDGSLRRNPSPAAWSRARVTAQNALAGYVDETPGSATHYHADYVLPFWSGNLQKVAVVGAHIFYRFRGAAGGSGALVDGDGSREMRAPQLAHLSAFHTDAAAGAAEAGPDPQLLRFTPLEIPDDVSSGQQARHPGYSLAMHMSTPANTAQPGRWAVDALQACRGVSECQVALYSNGAQVSANFRIAPTERGKPLFLFVRDAGSGTEIAMWDCEQVPRSQPSECLPADRAMLGRLLRSRG